MRGAQVFGETIFVHRKAVILTRDHHAPGIQLDDRMIRTGFKGQNLPKDSSGLVVRERSSGKEQHRACYPDAVETAGKDGLPETELETLNLPD